MCISLYLRRMLIDGLLDCKRMSRASNRVSYCSRYLATVAVVVDPSDRGRYRRVFHVVPSHDSLEIRGSHHKSADLNAPPMAQSGRSNELRE